MTLLVKLQYIWGFMFLRTNFENNPRLRINGIENLFNVLQTRVFKRYLRQLYFYLFIESKRLSYLIFILMTFYILHVNCWCLNIFTLICHTVFRIFKH